MSKYLTPKPYRVHLEWVQTFPSVAQAEAARAQGAPEGGILSQITRAQVTQRPIPPHPVSRVFLTMAYDPEEALAQCRLAIGPIPGASMSTSVDAVDWDLLSEEDRAQLELVRTGAAPDGSLKACLPRGEPPTPRG